MSPSAPPKRSSAAEHNKVNDTQKRDKALSSALDASDAPAAKPKTKRRRLNKDSDASGALRRAHRPLGPRNSNENVSASADRTPKKPQPAQHPHALASTPTRHANVTSLSRGARTRHKTSPLRKDEVRSLRSKDAARPKSDLSKYFPDFEDVILGETQEDDFFAPQTVLHIVDKDTRTFQLPIRSPVSSPNIKRKRQPTDNVPHSPTKSKASGPPKKTLDLATLADEWAREAQDPDADPLSDDRYHSHKRAERQEKQARNTDKERAMHEKSELERLLGDLRGPDWLRTLGISGITETQKRGLEPKRDLFTSRVQGLLDRFASWKEREKELKLEKEKRLLQFEDEDGDEAEQEEEEDYEDSDEADEQDESANEEDSESHDSDSALRRNARSAANDAAAAKKHIHGSSSKGRGKGSSARAKSSQRDRLSEPFTSFFQKRHLREAAMEKHRRGRNVTAFGQPIPDMSEADFELPRALVAEASGGVGARKRKRIKDEGLED